MGQPGPLTGPSPLSTCSYVLCTAFFFFFWSFFLLRGNTTSTAAGLYNANASPPNYKSVYLVLAASPTLRKYARNNAAPLTQISVVP